MTMMEGEGRDNSEYYGSNGSNKPALDDNDLRW